MQACRDAVQKTDRTKEANASLLLARYLSVPVKDEQHPTYRRELYDAARKAVNNTKAAYQLAYDRWHSAITNSNEPKCQGDFRTEGRMIIGLGGENVLETGITLDHTYGTPVIPGSALKGLAAHYCDQAWRDKFSKGDEHYQTIFGGSEDAGHIIFHDGWITPESLPDALKPDVMTPHHSDYYDIKKNAAPTDFDSPNPVTFLSVMGTFHIAVSCDVPDEEGLKWADLAFQLLSEALKEWGIGGKTNAGYGRLVGVTRTNSSPSQRR